MIKPEDQERVIESYERLTKAMEKEMDRISKIGPRAIPEVDFTEIQSNGGRLPSGLADVVREAGCIIVRGVVSEEQASNWERDLKAYTKKHPRVSGFPPHNPQTFGLFWTPAQVQIRSHPSVLQAMDAVSQLWHLTRDDGLFDMASQVIYADRYRVRRPSKGECPII